MSLYQQTSGFGQVSYPTSGYAQQAPTIPPQAYSYHQPQPMYYSDPSIFRRDYVSRLSDLTVNSRPIIQSLSMIAQDYTRFADIVAQCLEAHIRRVGHWMKLPAFYLLDAISKNVYDPYAAKFSAFVAPLFLETYAQVDQNTRSKMEEMLVTWRTGSPTGKELFGVAAQVKIERTIWGNDSRSVSDNSTRRFPQGSSPITRSQVLAELEVTLAQKDRLVHLNPFDTASKNHVNVLHQLRNLVEAGVSQEELGQILTQLRALARDTASVPPPPPQQQPGYNTAGPSSQPPFLSSSASQLSYPNSTGPSSQPIYPSQSSSQSYPAYGQSALLQPDRTFPDPVSSSSAPVVPPTSSILQMLNTLRKAGLMPTSSALAETGTFPSDHAKSEQVDPAIEAARDYARRILAMKIKLTTSDITRQRPQNIPFLYDRLPMQCKQCAIRFPEGSVGKKKMEDHLDMHFRQNRKASQNVGRGHSRSWFVGVEDWTHDITDDTNGKGRADTSRSAKTVAAAEAAEREASLRASFVVVPPGDEAKSILCPVCKETLKCEFAEDDEEWIWRNAIRIKDKIMHATCHAEMASSNSFAARLRNEVGAGGSRLGTPEIADSSRGGTPPKYAGTPMALQTTMRASKSPTPEAVSAGRKRKAEDEAPESLNEAGAQTPPTKRVAMHSISL